MRAWLRRRRLDPALRAVDRAMDRRLRDTRRELRRRLARHAVPGAALATTMRRVPPDDLRAVLDLLRRVDLGPAVPGEDPDDVLVDRLYDLLDDMGAGRAVRR
jgi:hypothetical protein